MCVLKTSPTGEGTKTRIRRRQRMTGSGSPSAARSRIRRISRLTPGRSRAASKSARDAPVRMPSWAHRLRMCRATRTEAACSARRTQSPRDREEVRGADWRVINIPAFNTCRAPCARPCLLELSESGSSFTSYAYILSYSKSYVCSTHTHICIYSFISYVSE